MSEAGKQAPKDVIGFKTQTARGCLVFLIVGFTVSLFLSLLGVYGTAQWPPGDYTALVSLVAGILSGLGLAVAISGIGVIRVLERIEEKLGQKD